MPHLVFSFICLFVICIGASKLLWSFSYYIACSPLLFLYLTFPFLFFVARTMGDELVHLRSIFVGQHSAGTSHSKKIASANMAK
jgi:hypothetical protein